MMGRPRLPGVKLVGLRLRKLDIAVAKRVGFAAGIGYQNIIRMWVAEKAAEVTKSEDVTSSKGVARKSVGVRVSSSAP